MADWTIKEGETEPVFADTLSYADGAPVDLTGATVAFVMRSHTAAQPLPLTGTVTVTNHTGGSLHFQPATGDTLGRAGMYMAAWAVTLAGETVPMTFPTEGYLWVSVEASLTTPGGQTLVGLPHVKDYLNIRAEDRTHDAKLMRFIDAVRPLIEQIAGPIIPQVFEEWHDGGQCYVALRRRPSTAPGTSPVLNLVGCEEFRGSVKHLLTIVADPSQGSTYSCMLDPVGRVVRRTAGGGVIAFPPMPQSVHVVYEAGQAVVPHNVYEATLELIRVNYQTTQQVGRGRRTVADEPEPSGPHLGFFVPGRVRELLAPNRRAPSIA